MADEDDDLDEDLPPKPAMTPEQEAYMKARTNKIVRERLARDRGERRSGNAPPPKTDAPPPDAIADIVSRTVAQTMQAMQPQQQQRPPAAAPTAPSLDNLPTMGGLVDYFNLSVEQIDALGPEGIREMHERAIKVGNRGAPPRPQTPNSRRR
jgi:hypothetical protein